MTTQKKVAITGGSGHLGNCLIEQLLHQDFAINALYTNNKPILSDINLNWIQGDITNKNAIQALIEDCDYLIHSAGMICIGDKNPEEVYRVNVIGTETIVDACIQKKNIRLIHISSSNAVQEGNKNEVFDEKRPYKTSADFAYPYTKATAEKYVLQAVKKHHLDALIIRPTSIVGPPDTKPSLLGQTILDINNNEMPAITSGGYNLIDVRDLAQTIINSFELGKSGEIYLVGGDFMSVEDIAKASNTAKTPLKISLNLLLVLMPVINAYQKMFKLKYPITKQSISTLKAAPNNMDISKAIKELNHKPRPATESIQDFITWSKQKQA